MKAAVWHAKHDVRVESVPDPRILNPRDAIVRVSLTAICGSDLHLYNGLIPSMLDGDIVGHEFMGEVVEVGSGVKNLRAGDRVVVPFPIACGACSFCRDELYSLCENSNPNAALAEKFWGYSPAGIYGYSHLLGGYAGGQAEYVRVPFADVNPIKIEDGMDNESVLFLSDILPTGYMAAENCGIREGDTVAVWGLGPVGQFAVQSARILGAGRVVAIDRFEERLEMARALPGVTVVNYEEESVYDRLMDLTGGRGPDSCIDAVGMEAHSPGPDGVYDRVKQALMLETERPNALREAMLCCRKGGTLSVAGVYGGFADKLPFGAVVNKALTIRSGQTHVQRYAGRLIEMIREGKFDPVAVITHRLSIDDAAEGYRLFRDKEEGAVKVVMTP